RLAQSRAPMVERRRAQRARKVQLRHVRLALAPPADAADVVCGPAVRGQFVKELSRCADVLRHGCGRLDVSWMGKLPTPRATIPPPEALFCVRRLFITSTPRTKHRRPTVAALLTCWMVLGAERWVGPGA